jgi:opacity protein-like surface antigen
MFKKLLATSAILATCSTMALAGGAPYLGASLGVVNNTASSGGSFRGIPLTISGGYGALVNQSIYLGGELFGTLGTSTLNNNAIVQSLKTTYGYGLGFIPGVMLSDHAMAYMRLGVVKTRFSNIGNTATGGQVGFGMQTSITQNWDLRGEYDYTKYRSISGVSPRSDTFNVGLVYKFE